MSILHTTHSTSRRQTLRNSRHTEAGLRRRHAIVVANVPTSSQEKREKKKEGRGQITTLPHSHRLDHDKSKVKLSKVVCALSPVPKGKLFTVIRPLRGYYDFTDSDRATTPGDYYTVLRQA